LPFGLPAVDAVLPFGGLALGALHEVLGAGADEEDGAVAAAFAAALLARLTRRHDGPVLWCLATGDLYAPGLAARGLAPECLIVARCRDDSDILWAMEEGLRSAALAAVLGEIGTLAPTTGRPCSSPARRAASPASCCGAGARPPRRRLSVRHRARRSRAGASQRRLAAPPASPVSVCPSGASSLCGAAAERRPPG